MVKIDFNRDYYQDLEVDPKADVNEIKRQFKKWALLYHPDRNPGHEEEFIAKFQEIQAAHEVLSDPQERARYDVGRVRSSFRNSYAGTSTSRRGNPWSNAGSEFPPPPKAPPFRGGAPPPSKGAAKYGKFATPQTSEGAQARKATYEAAYSNFRHRPQPAKDTPAPGQTRQSPKEPNAETPRSPRARTRASYDEFREDMGPGSTSKRTQNMRKNGFVPGTTGGGDEPPAPMGAYSTRPNRWPADPPQVPPRDPPSATASPDPLKQFREQADVHFEPRMSTPYATHGGERFNPFESTNINRSRSNREQFNKSDPLRRFSRTGSDPSLSSPHRAQTFAEGSTRNPKPHRHPTVEIDSSDSDDPQPTTRTTPRERVFAKPRSSAIPMTEQRMPNSAAESSNQRKHSNLNAFQKWWKANQYQDIPLSAFPADGPPGGTGPTNASRKQASMYAKYLANSSIPAVSSKASRFFPRKFSTVSEAMGLSKSDDASPYGLAYFKHDLSVKYPRLFSADAQSHVAHPSGATEKPAKASTANLADNTPPSSGRDLNAFEAAQRDVLDRLLSNKQKADGSASKPYTDSNDTADFSAANHGQKTSHDPHYPINEDRGTRSASTGSPVKKQKPSSTSRNLHFYGVGSKDQSYNANVNLKPSFSIPINEETFSSPRHSALKSNSAENISTKFAAEDWHGKFQAGGEYFAPNPNISTNPTNRGRPRSGSNRSRRQSPIKNHPVNPQSTDQKAAPDATVQSPGGTKFTAEEWIKSFKPQTFAPPPYPAPPSKQTAPPRILRKSRGQAVRPTMGTAAVVDDGDSSDSKPLFTAKKPSATSGVTEEDPMDVDTPPVLRTQPSFETETQKAGTEPLKRPAVPSASPSPADTEALKVNFDDLKIQDLLSSLDLPKPPNAPFIPAGTKIERPTPESMSDYLSKFQSYMSDYDLFSSHMMLHMVARKNQNDGMGDRRWKEDLELEVYRRGLKEDQLVMEHWKDAMAEHSLVMKDYAIAKERMKNRDERGQPRKKTR
ncbi:hypothetical protein B7494_g1637 [Chlorociboria aeruginascens]|nr:hypothetical protein B7494_g1637 [Chlorociboria aeruginascens]